MSTRKYTAERGSKWMTIERATKARRDYLKIAFGIIPCTPLVPSTTCVMW
jgi:hypothetical protein